MKRPFHFLTAVLLALVLAFSPLLSLGQPVRAEGETYTLTAPNALVTCYDVGLERAPAGSYEIPAGAEVSVSYDIFYCPRGHYIDGWDADAYLNTSYRGTYQVDFTMPAQDVTVSQVYTPQKDVILDMTEGSCTLPAAEGEELIRCLQDQHYNWMMQETETGWRIADGSYVILNVTADADRWLFDLDPDSQAPNYVKITTLVNDSTVYYSKLGVFAVLLNYGYANITLTPGEGSGDEQTAQPEFGTRYVFPDCPFAAPNGMEFDCWEWRNGSGDLWDGSRYLPGEWFYPTDSRTYRIQAVWKPAGHVHEFTKVPAKYETCEEDGHGEYYVCEGCGRFFPSSLTEASAKAITTWYVWPATGHDWGDWEITLSPTADAPGERTRVCRRDPSHTETEAIPALADAPVSPISVQYGEARLLGYDEVITEAPAGASVIVTAAGDPPVWKYVASFSSADAEVANLVTAPNARAEAVSASFTMPEQSVAVSAVLGNQIFSSLDLSSQTSVSVPKEQCAYLMNALSRYPVVEAEDAEWYLRRTYDLNGDTLGDVRFSFFNIHSDPGNWSGTLYMESFNMGGSFPLTRPGDVYEFVIVFPQRETAPLTVAGNGCGIIGTDDSGAIYENRPVATFDIPVGTIVTPYIRIGLFPYHSYYSGWYLETASQPRYKLPQNPTYGGFAFEMPAEPATLTMGLYNKKDYAIDLREGSVTLPAGTMQEIWDSFSVYQTTSNVNTDLLEDRIVRDSDTAYRIDLRGRSFYEISVTCSEGGDVFTLDTAYAEEAAAQPNWIVLDYNEPNDQYTDARFLKGGLLMVVTGDDSRTLRFLPGDGSGSMADGTWHAGEEVTLPEPAFTAPEGKVFAGWAQVEDAEGRWGYLHRVGDAFVPVIKHDLDVLAFEAVWAGEGCYHEDYENVGTDLDPTCEEEGFVSYSVCNVCGYMVRTGMDTPLRRPEDAVIPALGHDWGEWQVVTPATETEDGLEERHCLRDSEHTETRVIPATGSPELADLFAHSVSFGSDLALIYYVPVDRLEGCENIRLVGTRDRHAAGSTEVTSDGVTITEYQEGDFGAGPEYRFVYDDIATKEIGDVLRLRLMAEKDGQTYMSPLDEFSAKDYAYSRLQKSSNVKFKRMIADLLYFCAKAQVYFGYDTEHLATDRMTEEFDAYSTHGAVTPVDNRREVPLEGATAEWTGVNTVFESKVELKYYFALNEDQPKDNVKFRLSYTTASGTPVEEIIPLEDCLYDKKNKEYAYTYGGLAAKDMRVLITTQILDGDTVISPDKIYSLESYAAGRIANSSKPEFVELMYYMMAYGISAENNFGN